MRALLLKLLSLALFGAVFYGIAAFAEWQIYPAEWPPWVRGVVATMTLSAWLWDSLKNA